MAIKLPAKTTPANNDTGDTTLPGTKTSATKGPRRGKNSDLPPGTLTRYKQVMVPQIIEKIGRNEDPWDFASTSAATEVSHIWALIFPTVDVGHDIDISSPIFLLVRHIMANQRRAHYVTADYPTRI